MTSLVTTFNAVCLTVSAECESRACRLATGDKSILNFRSQYLNVVLFRPYVCLSVCLSVRLFVHSSERGLTVERQAKASEQRQIDCICMTLLVLLLLLLSTMPMFRCATEDSIGTRLCHRMSWRKTCVLTDQGTFVFSRNKHKIC